MGKLVLREIKYLPKQVSEQMTWDLGHLMPKSGYFPTHSWPWVPILLPPSPQASPVSSIFWDGVFISPRLHCLYLRRAKKYKWVPINAWLWLPLTPVSCFHKNFLSPLYSSTPPHVREKLHLTSKPLIQGSFIQLWPPGKLSFLPLHFGGSPTFQRAPRGMSSSLLNTGCFIPSFLESVGFLFTIKESWLRLHHPFS